ncbi:MAG: cobyric acid synthase [Clostridia bacterium]
MRGKGIMIQGTGSSVGKSLLCAGLCRIFKEDGLSVAPFKAQNMALNSFATSEGLEMGRAQVVQAEAAGIVPDVRMNPVLLKPTSDRQSQVVLNGRPLRNMTALDYHAFKVTLRENVRAAYESLAAEYGHIVLEGAGSPAEINLRESDIVNMAMAEMADVPVLLVGDIDRGGVFASLLGTMEWLTPKERARVKGVVINKFRGDVEILRPGLKMLEERIHVPVVGVIPYMKVDLEDEDSLSDRFSAVIGDGDINIKIVRLDHIANFTDFQSLTLQNGVRVSYATTARELEGADIIVLPGTKNTIGDLLTLRKKGMDAQIIRHAHAGGLVLGVCGGYQMMGSALYDPEGMESETPEAPGLGLIDMTVQFYPGKKTVQTDLTVEDEHGWLAVLCGETLNGYEIHSGQNTFGPEAVIWLGPDGARNPAGNVLGTYLHGLFDQGAFAQTLIDHARSLKGLAARGGEVMTMSKYREEQFDLLARGIRKSLDMPYIYRVLRGEA